MRIRKVNNRAQRVSQEVRRNISDIILYKINDPRIGIVTVSDIRMSNDFKIAKIFITFLNKENSEEINDAISILQKASCFIRFLLANSMDLRVVPELFFKYDSSLIDGIKMYSLITSLMKRS